MLWARYRTTYTAYGVAFTCLQCMSMGARWEKRKEKLFFLYYVLPLPLPDN